MSCFNASRLLVLVLLLAVAGCGPLPRPFKAGNGQGVESPFEATRDSAGVVVAPVEGAPAAFAGPLADILAEKLAAKGVPATTAGALRNGYLLEGLAMPSAAEGQVVIDWNLSDDAGRIVKAFSTRHVLPPGAWQTGAANYIDAIATIAATAVSDSLQAPLAAVQTPADAERPGLAVIAVEGAPGDGNQALKTAFVAVLRRVGLPVVDDPEQAAIHIFGKVDMAPTDDGKDDLSITWTLREPDGAEISVLTQSNEVPRGSLDGEWGPLAYDITTAIIDGIVQVLQIIDDTDEIRRR